MIGEDLREDIPEPMLSFAKHVGPKLVPLRRTSGYTENSTQKRGQGDIQDLIGTLMLFEYLTSYQVVCSMDITSGRGDNGDVKIWVDNPKKQWPVQINVKTSSFAPYRSGLHLYVKEEELASDIFVYVHVFVHLQEMNIHDYPEEPHTHISGFVKKSSEVWKTAVKDIRPIPNTGGHKGVHVKMEDLSPMSELVAVAKKKF